VLKLLKKNNISVNQINNIIGSTMFIKSKHNETRKLKKLKAFFITDGHGQDRALYPDVTLLIATVPGIVMCLIVAAKEKRRMAKCNIGRAYLHAKMKGEKVTSMRVG
jgi:hypothetical protein